MEDRKDGVAMPQERGDEPFVRAAGIGFPATADNEHNAEAVGGLGRRDVKVKTCPSSAAVADAPLPLGWWMEIDTTRSDRRYEYSAGEEGESGQPLFEPAAIGLWR